MLSWCAIIFNAWPFDRDDLSAFSVHPCPARSTLSITCGALAILASFLAILAAHSFSQALSLAHLSQLLDIHATRKTNPKIGAAIIKAQNRPFPTASAS